MNAGSLAFAFCVMPKNKPVSATETDSSAFFEAVRSHARAESLQASVNREYTRNLHSVDDPSTRVDLSQMGGGLWTNLETQIKSARLWRERNPLVSTITWVRAAIYGFGMEILPRESSKA